MTKVFYNERRTNVCTSGFEQLCELAGWHRAAEIVSLRLITLVSLKECQLFQRFDAFRHHSQIKASAHTDNRGHDRCLVGNGGELADERLVDLESIDGKFSEIAQAGIARAKVIDRQSYPFGS